MLDLSPRRPPPAPPPAFGTAGRTLREAVDSVVCIVDDDPGVLDSLRVMLEAYGFAVTTCGSGNEFLADGRYRQIGCLIIDQHMPGMTGLDVFAALRGRGVAVPTILVTGGLVPAIARRARQLGLTAVLEKPFSAAHLVELVRASLDRAK